MNQVRGCAMCHAFRFCDGALPIAVRTFAVCLATVLVLAAFTGAPAQVYARAPYAGTAQQAPLADEDAPGSAAAIEPNLASVQMDLSAAISGDLIVYTLFATNVTDQPVRDLTIRMPLPAGTMLLGAKSAAPFVTDRQDGVVSFYAAELRAGAGSGPHRVVASVVGEGDTLLSTFAEATWGYLDSVMRQSSVFVAKAETSAVSVFPATFQHFVADMVNEVPLAHVDMTGITIQQEGSIVRMNIELAGPLGAVGEPAEFIVYIDADCDATTGRARQGLGAEYRVRYRHQRGQADIGAWTQSADVEGQWLLSGSIAVNSPVGGQAITLWIPSILIDNSSQFCWMAESEYRAAAGTPKLPKDRLPNGAVTPTFTRFERWDDVRSVQTSLLIPSLGTMGNGTGGGTPAAQAVPSASVASPAQLSGTLAIPLRDAAGAYDVYVFSVPDGALVQRIADASQPSFRADGMQLLVTRQAEGGGEIYQYESENEAGVISGVPSGSSYPSYNAQGTRMVYEALEGLPVSAGSTYSVTLMQCELSAVPQEGGGSCGAFSILQTRTAADAVGEVHGTNPLWTDDGRVVYRGCHVWNGVERCGIYATGNSTDSLSEPAFPTLLTHDPSALPNDSKGNIVTMAAQRAEDWDVYAVSLDGTWLVDVSRDALAQDGLSAISPDGGWVAFVSNRDGAWAVWVSPLDGGDVHKLFDLPSGGSWAEDEWEWGRQRLSWGR